MEVRIQKIYRDGVNGKNGVFLEIFQFRPPMRFNTHVVVHNRFKDGGTDRSLFELQIRGELVGT